MNTSASSVKKSCGLEFTEIFRAILYSTRLTWGAKCLAFAILDLPISAIPRNAVMARKLHSSPAQVSVWRQELIRNKLSFRKEKS
jgi:hypothetical protein